MAQTYVYLLGFPRGSEFPGTSGCRTLTPTICILFFLFISGLALSFPKPRKLFSKKSPRFVLAKHIHHLRRGGSRQPFAVGVPAIALDLRKRLVPGDRRDFVRRASGFRQTPRRALAQPMQR